MDEQELQRLFEKLRDGIELTEAEMAALAKNAGAANAAFEYMKQSLKGLARGTKDMALSMYEGQQGAGAFNKQINAGANAVANIADNFGVLGKVIGGVIKAFTFFTTEALAQSDRLFTVYQNFSRQGLAGAGGLDELRSSAQRLGYGLDQVGLDNFTRLMTSGSAALARLGGTAFDGQQAFAQFATGIQKGQIGRELMMMGFTVEGINEGIMDYTKLMSSMGRIQTMREGQLQRQSVAYLETLDELTKVTGLQRDSITSQIQDDIREERYLAEVERIRRTEGDTVANRLLANVGAVSQMFPELSKQIKSSIGGFITNEDAAKGVISGFGNLGQLLKGDIAPALQALGQQALVNRQRFADQAALVGYASDVMGSYREQVELSGLANMDSQEIQKRLNEGTLKQRKGTDDAVKAQVETRIAQMNTRDSLQNLVNKGVAPATRALAGFAKFIGRIANLPEELLGLEGPAGGQRPTEGVTPPAAAPAGAAAGLKGAAAKNLNPGNLRFANQAGAKMGTSGFAQFETVDAGLAALARDLNAKLTGASQHGKLDTLATLITKYAPPNENDTQAYITKMSKHMGINPYANISKDPASLAKLMAGIIGIENHGDPARGYDFRGGIQTAVAQVLGVDPSKIGKFARGGIVNKPSIAGEAGPEAVVPLPDGKTIPVRIEDSARLLASYMPNNQNLAGVKLGSELVPVINTAMTGIIDQFKNDNASNQTAFNSALEQFRRDMQNTLSQSLQSDNMLKLFNELIDINRQQAATSEKLLQVSRT